MIQVIERVFRILEELSLDGEVSLEALARVTKLNKGTLCNILRSIIELGYIERTRGGYYRLSSQLSELCHDCGMDKAALDKMRETVTLLAESTGESGVISMLRSGKVSIIAQAQKKRILMINTHEVYAALSLFASVSGRILVAYLSADERSRLIRRTGLPGEEWDNISSMAELETACENIRSQQLCIMENKELEIIAFAVPVKWRDQVLAMGLTVPLLRCATTEKKREIANLLKAYTFIPEK